MDSWQLQEAKSRMSELVRRAQRGPQHITVHGKPVAVVMSQARFESLTAQRTGSLVDFIRNSPLAESDDLVIERNRSKTRRGPKL